MDKRSEVRFTYKVYKWSLNIKRCPIWLITDAIKTTSTILPTIFSPICKRISTVDRDMSQLDPSYIASRNVKFIKSCKMLWRSLKNVKHKFTIGPSNPSHRNLPKRNRNICPYNNFCVNGRSSIVHNSQKEGTNQTSINWWMDKPDAMHAGSGIFFDNTKEQGTDKGCNVDDLKSAMLSERIWTQ